MTDRKTILYAEDEPDVRRSFAKSLSANFPGYITEPLHDGNVLERRLSNGLEEIRLVITDHEMPGKRGLDIIKTYAREERFRKIPFILFYAGHEMIGKVAVENGAFAYVGKLSGMDNLIATVKRALESSS